MERSDILFYENHLSFVEILFTGPKFKGKEGYPIADQSTYCDSFIHDEFLLYIYVPVE